MSKLLLNVGSGAKIAKKSLPKIRIFVQNDLENIDILNHQVEIANGDFNYLVKVMRKQVGDKICVFNGKDGEFIAEIANISKKNLHVQIVEKIANIYNPPQITLAFALVKNVRIDFIASKACELGVTCFIPIVTQRTIVDKINQQRFISNIKEAAEQCNRNDFPQVKETIKLEKFLKNAVKDKIIIVADESGNGYQAQDIFPKIKNIKNSEIILFIGPEGGFTSEEFKCFDNLKNCYKLNLGPRILRADTAIISSLTLIQEFLGDFNLKPKFYVD